MEHFYLREYEELLESAGRLVSANLFGKEELSVLYLTYNSKAVVPGTLFICKGAAFKEEYLLDAVQSGAVGYVSEKAYPAAEGVPCLLVDDIRVSMPLLADQFFNAPSEKLKITAFGGTKGKSTSTYFMKAIVDDYMQETGGKERDRKSVV